MTFVCYLYYNLDCPTSVSSNLFIQIFMSSMSSVKSGQKTIIVCTVFRSIMTFFSSFFKKMPHAFQNVALDYSGLRVRPHILCFQMSYAI